MHDKKSWEIKFVNIKKLNAFRAVLESNSITGAADKLGLTQSGVSRLILSLEQELDFPLFNRIKGKIQVTSRGESFFQEIEPLLSGIDQIPTIARQVKQHQYSRLRIITLNSLAHSLVPVALKGFCQKHPHANVSVTIKSRKELIHWEGGEHFDVALASLPFEQRIFKKKPFIKFSAVVAISDKDPLFNKKEININDLRKKKLISLETTGIFQTSIKKKLQQLNVEPLVKIQTTSMLQSAQMVANDIGIAIVDPFIGNVIKSNKVSIKPLKPAINFDYAYIWPEGRELSYLAEEFILETVKIAKKIINK
jgi:DNA-binding transcriptional LysR family regulator